MNKKPLSESLRPINLDEVFGQEHLTGPNGFIRKCIEQKTLFSIIFYGPSGVGKTTLALIIAKELKTHYRIMNATSTNKKEMEIIIEEAKMYGHLIVIIDEIHRLNKEKQDFLLSHIESGLITIIGATTINPFVSINPAIRSRCHILKLNPLDEESIFKVLKNALTSPRGLNNEYKCEDKVLRIIAKNSNGDVRFAINSLQICSMTAENNLITIENVTNNFQVPNYMLDEDGDAHYNLVSALQKSIRGSDVDAALYYLAKLCLARDLDSIERRLLVIAYEDVGLGNPNAVNRTVNALETARKVGFPEAVIPLSFAVIDLSLSPKSKSAYLSINKAMEIAKNAPADIPEYLKLNPVGLSKENQYSYELKEIWPLIRYLPKEIKDMNIYEYVQSGNYEKALIENYKKLKKVKRSGDIASLKKNFLEN